MFCRYAFNRLLSPSRHIQLTIKTSDELRCVLESKDFWNNDGQPIQVPPLGIRDLQWKPTWGRYFWDDNKDDNNIKRYHKKVFEIHSAKVLQSRRSKFSVINMTEALECGHLSFMSKSNTQLSKASPETVKMWGLQLYTMRKGIMRRLHKITLKKNIESQCPIFHTFP